MRLGCLLVVIGVGLTILGWEGLHNASSFKNPKTISYTDFVKSKPKEGWFRVTGCRIFVTQAVYQRRKEHRGYKTDVNGESVRLTSEEENNDVWISQAWFPVHNSTTWSKDDKVGMVLSVESGTPENERILSGVEDLIKIQEGKLPLSKEQLKSWGHDNAGRLIITADFNGMIDAGFLASEDDRKDVERLNEAVEPGFVMLKNGYSPSSTVGALFLLVVGIVVDVLALLVWLSFFLKLLGFGTKNVDHSKQ